MHINDHYMSPLVLKCLPCPVFGIFQFVQDSRRVIWILNVLYDWLLCRILTDEDNWKSLPIRKLTHELDFKILSWPYNKGIDR